MMALHALAAILGSVFTVAAGPVAPAIVQPAPIAAPTSAPAVIASDWSLPPLIRISGRRAVGRATRAGVLETPWLALAPRVRRGVRAHADLAALEPLLTVSPPPAGPVLVLALRGRHATVQATTLADSQAIVAALGALPAAGRPRVVLEPAPGDLADSSGPPPPRAGQLASLVPVYQESGTRHGIDWRILAAINVVETSLGADVSTSSAGALGWMQFMPGTWRQYGTDASGDGIADPYDPRDAIESAAIYLEANGARHDLRRAVFAYNHAWWYVDRVLRIAADLPAAPRAR